MTQTKRHLQPISTLAMRGACAAVTFVVALAALAARPAQAQSFHVLYTFTGEADGSAPYADLVRDGEGNLYGAAYYGGAGGYGTVFKLNASNEFSVLYSFRGGNDGGQPLAGLVLDPAGNLYGTAENSAAAGGGTLFKLDERDNFTVLYSFAGGQDGAIPNAVIRDSAGNLYGTASRGGDFRCDPVYGCGTVFKVDTRGQETVMHSFTGKPDGQRPGAGLVRDSEGNLYGSTVAGGSHDDGTVFKLDRRGKETVLYSFTAGSDGSYPTDALVRDAEGNLYATANMGGDLKCNAPYGCGTVFTVNEHGKFTVLHAFSGEKDGAFPYAGLVRDALGNLYGTTAGGGVFDGGIVFKLDESGRETVLYSFSGKADGTAPYAGMVRDDESGNLYGATVYGGDLSCNAPYGCGVVFELTP